MPLRTISWKELVVSYQTFTEKEITSKLTYVTEGLAKNKKELVTTKYEDTKKYLTNLIVDRTKEIKKLEEDITNLKNWYNQILKHSNINETARVGNIRLEKAEIENFMNSNTTENTYPVWIEDISFFDSSKPKDQPQCIYFSVRRQDDNQPKKNFMDLFFNEFNMDVLALMAGELPKNKAGINTINASLKDAKIETKLNQATTESYSYSFDTSPVNQFPSGWQGMNNITVKEFENKNWLAFTKNGYWYPKQYNKEIKDNFNLSFHLRWNKDIPYSSSSFTVSFSSLNYDNASEMYKPDGNANIMSLYDSYAGNFNRVMLWFDPYWNGAGTLTVYSYDAKENLPTNKRITLPDFYMAKNNHQINIQRKGNSLVVLINDKKEAELEDVFLPAAKYNLYTFSRYKGTEDKNDVFYLNNIEANYR